MFAVKRVPLLVIEAMHVLLSCEVVLPFCPAGCRCGMTDGPAIAGVAAAYTLPTDREATADEKKRSAVIYAETLRAALRRE